MKNATVIFAPGVDEAVLKLADYVDPSDLYRVLNFVENLQKRLVKTLSTFPMSGPKFKGGQRSYTIDGYRFVYRYAELDNEVYVVDMIGPGQNWR